MKFTLGIDEAGRGPILGPLVLGGVALTPVEAKKLQEAGVVDSKKFGSGDKARKKRESLEGLIKEIASAFEVRVVSEKIVDDACADKGLNRLEQSTATEIIESLMAQQVETNLDNPKLHQAVQIGAQIDQIILDGEKVFGPLCEKWPDTLAVNQGESFHTAVAAASILAKTERDRKFLELITPYEQEFGQIKGGGYLNVATRRFIEAYYSKYGQLPECTRLSWNRRTLNLVEPTSSK